MEIIYLADRMEFTAELARLHFQEWSYLRPGQSLEARTERLQGSCGRKSVPAVVIAVAEGSLRGPAMLVACDMDTRPDLTPWLCGVYVAEEFRHQGIGSALVRQIEQEARGLGYARLYLYTPSEESFYARRGWSVMERYTYRGSAVTLMAKALGNDERRAAE